MRFCFLFWLWLWELLVVAVAVGGADEFVVVSIGSVAIFVVVFWVLSDVD